MANLNLKKCLVLILALALSISAFTFGAFAEEAAGSSSNKLSANTIVGIVIAAAIVITVIVFVCIFAANKEKREKFFQTMRAYKSELKKIVWCTGDQLRKNSIVVIVSVAICAVVIALLDLGFSKGFLALGSLF